MHSRWPKLALILPDVYKRRSSDNDRPSQVGVVSASDRNDSQGRRSATASMLSADRSRTSVCMCLSPAPRATTWYAMGGGLRCTRFRQPEPTMSSNCSGSAHGIQDVAVRPSVAASAKHTVKDDEVLFEPRLNRTPLEPASAEHMPDTCEVEYLTLAMTKDQQ